MMPSQPMAGEVLPYLQGESLKGSAAVCRRLSSSPATGLRWWSPQPGEPRDAMDPTIATPPYSAIVDALDKFYAASEPIQALWVVALTAMVLGVTRIVMRGVREIVAVVSRPAREAGASMHCRDAQGV
jgi:hypothetical protein